MNLSRLAFQLAGIIAALHVASCTAAQGRAAEAALLGLGEAACEAFLPMAAPGLGSADALVCKGAETAIAAALAAAGVGAPSTPAVSPAGGSAPEAERQPYRPVLVKSRVVALVRVRADQHAAAQAWLAKGAR